MDLFHKTLCVYGFLLAAFVTIFVQCDSGKTTSGNLSVPQYKFHYHVHDDKTGDYKSQEEDRNGDNIEGSYVVGEPNGGVRVVKYAADDANGFRANVTVQQPGGIAPKDRPNGFFAGGLLNKLPYRPLRGFHPFGGGPIVTQQLTQQQYRPLPPQIRLPPNYSFQTPERATTTATEGPTTPPKSIEVELNYKDETTVKPPPEPATVETTKDDSPPSEDRPTQVETGGEGDGKKISVVTAAGNVGTGETSSTENAPSTESTPTEFIRQKPQNIDLSAMGIPQSIIDILNRHKNVFVAKELSPPSTNHLGFGNSEPSTSQPSTANSNYDTTSPLRGTTKISNRPIRLVGLHPLILDNFQLQSLTDHPVPSSSYHQLHLQPLANIPYMAAPPPASLFTMGPLLGAPSMPPSLSYRNAQRSIQNHSEIHNPRIPLLVPIPFQSVAYPPLPFPPPTQYIPYEEKQEIKPDKPIPYCADCLFPPIPPAQPAPSYTPYPIARAQNNAKACADHASANDVYQINPSMSIPYRPGFALLLIPSQIQKKADVK